MAPVGAMAKFSSSMSKGALAFSFDDKFIEKKRETEMRNKPKTISDGMKKGFASAASSVSSGFTGLVSKPYEGAR